MVVAFLGPAVGMVAMSYNTTNTALALACLVVGMGLNGATGAGHQQNFYLLARNRSGALFGLSNGVGNLSGVISPYVASGLTSKDPSDPGGWQIFFIITAALYAAASIFFVTRARDEQQQFDRKMYAKCKVKGHKQQVEIKT